MSLKKILFIVDELEFKWFEFNQLVTNFWFIRGFLKRGIDVYVSTKSRLFIKNVKGCAFANRAILLDDGEISYSKEENDFLIEFFDVVFFRSDPPMDVDYINACSVFEFVDMNKVKVINNPLAIKAFNEKMHVNLFPQFVPENVVTNTKSVILDFVKKHEKAIIKPLNRCFGSGVFVLQNGDANLSSIISTATDNGKTMVMVQEYLQGAVNGDKRVMLVGEDVMDECVRKLPAKDDFKFAEHSDKYFEKAILSDEEKFVAKIIAKKLTQIGLPLVGLDMIDGKVIEINVTSPCYFIKEVNALCGGAFEEKIMSKIFRLCEINDLDILKFNPV